MGNVGLAFRNRAIGATYSGGSWNSTYPRPNLGTSDLDEIARTSNALRASTRWRCDFGAAYLLRVGGKRKHNLSANALWRERIGLAEYDVDFTSGVLDDRFTFGGGANGSRINSAGAIVAASAGRIEYDPGTWDNLFTLTTSGFTSGSWVVGGTQGKTVILDAETIVLAQAGGVYQTFAGVMPSQAYNASCEIRLVSGSGVVRLDLFDGVTTQYGAEFTPTADWQWYSADYTSGAGNVGLYGFPAVCGVVGVSGDVVIQMRKPQLKSGATRIYPGDIVAAHRPNTSSSPLCRCFGVVREGARTQLMDATNNITPGTASWTSANLTAGGASGTLLGLSAWLFTVTVAGNAWLRQLHTVGASTTYTAEFACTVGVGTTRIVLDDGAGGSSTTLTFDAPLHVAPGTFIYTRTFTTSATQTRADIRVGVVDGALASTFRVAAPQLEAGDTASTHIINAGGAATTVTRSADTITLTLAAAVTSGAMFHEGRIRRRGTPTTTRAISTQLRNAAASSSINLRSAVTSGLNHYCDVSVAGLKDGTNTTVGNYTLYRSAVAFANLDWRQSVNGAAVWSEATDAVPSGMDVLDLCRSPAHSDVLGRFVLWSGLPQSDTRLNAITSVSGIGPGALGLDTGWRSGMEFSLTGDTPTNWGDQYDLLSCASADFRGRYQTVDILDEGNTAGYVQVSLNFAGEMFQPARGASYGEANAVKDWSTSTTSVTGRKSGTERDRQRQQDFALRWLTVAEGRAAAELVRYVGVLGEVVVLRDTADMAASQFWGGHGTLRELTAIEIPYPLTNAWPVRWEQSL